MARKCSALRSTTIFSFRLRLEAAAGRERLNKIIAAGVVALLTGISTGPDTSAQLNLFDNSPFPVMLQPQQAPGQGQGQYQRKPVQLPQRASRLEELIQRIDYPVAFLQPLSLAGLKIPGLNAKSIQMLGQNFFVVLANTKYATMSEVYRDNRLRGKSNFVTADCVVHPYFAFTNRVIADAVTEQIAPELESMLKAMLERSLADYKHTEDTDVREDIEHNIAFLAVAVKLIEPKFFPPIPLHVVPMVQADLNSIYSGHGAESAIFERTADFSSFQPLGWYNSNAGLQNFFRCREWITQMSYPFTDVAFGTKGSKGNYFRRSALLYRTLELATVREKPAYEIWERLYKAWPLFGAQLKDWNENTISPLEYRAQVKTDSADLKVTLNALAEPLFRTKLLLSVRKQKPLKLGSASILDLESSRRGSGESPVSFRLLPITGDPEWPWLKACTTIREAADESAATWPFPLLVLHAWGAPQANNALLDNFMRLDTPVLLKVLPDLDQLVMTKLPGGVVKPIEDRRWQILSGYFKPAPEGAQQVTRTEAWMTRMLESAFSGWVDSHLAIAPDSKSEKPQAEKKSLPAKDAAEPPAEESAPTRKARVPLFHCVQPSPEIFQKIAEDAEHLESNLSALGYLPDRFKDRFLDFIRLSQRLKKMAEIELKGQSLPLSDIKLLASIDLILDRVELPTEDTLPLQSPNAALPNTKIGAATNGVTFGLGRPGQLFIILQEGNNWTLGRGAVYTYYDVPGAPITAEHWRRKLDNDLVRPPFWAEKFDTVQEAAVPKK